jgi:hypothetical protein
MDYAPNTLGYHRAMAAAVFGEDSHAVKFLDKKIAEIPDGANEKVIVDERQMVALLTQIHYGGDFPIKNL